MSKQDKARIRARIAAGFEKPEVAAAVVALTEAPATEGTAS